MSDKQSGRMIILSGPSAIGKSILEKSLKSFYPEISNRWRKLILYNSRTPRPGEVDGVDYHFRKIEEVELLRSDKRYLVINNRGDLQALDIEELLQRVKESDVLFEGNTTLGRALQVHQDLNEVEKLSVFLSPLSKEEIIFLKTQKMKISFPEFVKKIMKKKLLRRSIQLNIDLSEQNLENLEIRAADAYHELKIAWRFDYVIPNHDGEDSENWLAFGYPLGDARKAMLTFAELLEGKKASYAEKWEENLVP